ncbi:MAG TPA: TetR family transcriptional regulator [Longimicrobiales bacterium]
MKQGTPATLLAAARRLFAKHGYDGTSVRAITTAAGANLGAITYHFGSKRKLYDAVLESCARPLADAAVLAAHGPGTPSERVLAVVRTYFEYLASNADVAQLMLQELVLGRTPPAASTLPIRRIHGALSDLVKEGQKAGEFRAGDAGLMAISIVSQPVHMNMVRRGLQAFADLDLEDARTRERVIAHVTEFARAGLSAQEGKS